MFTLNVRSDSNDTKLLKKIRKSVEKILQEAQAADDKLDYTIDSSFSHHVRPRYGIRGGYVRGSQVSVEED